MSQELINHSADLKQLQDEGYGIQEKGGLLINSPPNSLCK